MKNGILILRPNITKFASTPQNIPMVHISGKQEL